jgi:hypothetical protein
VCHPDGRIVAVCGDLEGQCATLDLELEDIVIHELDLEKLVAALCGQLGLDIELRPLGLADHLWQVGWYEPVAGERFAVCLLLPVSSEQVHEAAVWLRGHFDRALVLLTPSSELVEPATAEYVRARRCCVLYLEEVLGILSGNWEVLCSAETALDDFRRDVVGEVRAGIPEHRFPTAPGTTWKDVLVRFIDGHQVEIRARGRHGVFHYAQMRMAKKNTDQATVQWELLVALGDGWGEFRWPRCSSRRTLQKRRERLADHLRSFFGIPEDPFDDLPRSQGFKTRFTISLER